MPILTNTIKLNAYDQRAFVAHDGDTFRADLVVMYDDGTVFVWMAQQTKRGRDWANGRGMWWSLEGTLKRFAFAAKLLELVQQTLNVSDDDTDANQGLSWIGPDHAIYRRHSVTKVGARWIVTTEFGRRIANLSTHNMCFRFIDHKLDGE